MNIKKTDYQTDINKSNLDIPKSNGASYIVPFLPYVQFMDINNLILRYPIFILILDIRNSIYGYSLFILYIFIHKLNF